MKWQSIRQLLDEWDIEEGLKIESENGTIAVILGSTYMDKEEEDRAYGYMLESSSGFNYKQSEHPADMKTFVIDRKHWKIWEEPPPAEMVKHYPAIYENKSSGAGYTVSGTIYYSEEQAKRCINNSSRKFVRLATEQKPIMLVADMHFQSSNPLVNPLGPRAIVTSVCSWPPAVGLPEVICVTNCLRICSWPKGIMSASASM